MEPLEKRHQKIVPTYIFLKRVLRSLAVALTLMFVALLMGMEGYHHYEDMPWVDAYVNAAMILSGMGPVGELKTVGGKIFAGSYALFSGIFFLVIMAIVLGPVVHRFFHQFHLEETNKNDAKEK